MKKIIISVFVFALWLGLDAGIALPAKEAAAHHAQGQMSMMGCAVMPQGMGPMMGLGMGPKVVPIKHLSTDDVGHFLERRLDGQGNKRLKVGSVEEKDNATIAAEIVSADGSLVQRLEVDRHTGLIEQVTT